MRVQRQIDQLLAQRAAEWVEALRSGERRDHAAFLEWMRESKLHVEHYLETEALDRQIQALGPTRGPDLQALLGRLTPDISTLPRATRLRRRLPLYGHGNWAVAAALAVMAIGAGALWSLRQIYFPPNQIATAAGEQRTMTLADGSQITVNALSRLRIGYSARERGIELKAGEALFKVAPDAARPFLVRTRTSVVRALGTQFNVYQRMDDTALVSVVEGRVQVTLIASSRDAQELGAGEEAQVDTRHIEKRKHPDIAKTLAWREGRLYFDNTPLEDIVGEFNRYGGPLHLKLEGIAAGQYRFGGVFNANEPGALVDILERQKDLAVERQGGGEVVIRPK